ncbi:SRPBCC family protein [Streptomyces sp. NPDC020681]|uniref:SRPBCC family protein n=1 Tax=Streptomyces sp. NPDC020681 TaxID=3365083 RepID=UPI0037AF114B
MQLHHTFTVPVPVDEAWQVLLDIERIAPCMPGATVEGYDSEIINGSVKVKLGPVTVTYKGTAAFDEKDEAAHRMVLTARGKEVRGQGTASATVTSSLAGSGSGTEVDVVTDLTITGRPAQFGRGVMAEVGDKLIGQFADCLSQQLSGDDGRSGAEPARAEFADDVPAAARDADADTDEAVPIDLLRAAGLPVAKRAAAVLAAAALATLVAILVHRRCRR